MGEYDAFYTAQIMLMVTWAQIMIIFTWAQIIFMVTWAQIIFILHGRRSSLRLHGRRSYLWLHGRRSWLSYMDVDHVYLTWTQIMFILHGRRSSLWLHGRRSCLCYMDVDHDYGYMGLDHDCVTWAWIMIIFTWAQIMIFEFDFCFTLRTPLPPIHLQGEKAISLSYGHTQLNPPHPVRSAKLNSRWQSQYYGGGPHGNTLCCSFLFFFCQSFIFCPHTHLICTHLHTWWSPFCLSCVPFTLTHT